jgi:hypothetical protein
MWYGLGGDYMTINANVGMFQLAQPPPLAPGLTEPVPPPDPTHRHQLKLLRLD